MKVRGDSKPQATTTDSRSLRFEFVEIFGFTLAPLCGKLNFFSPVADYFSLHQPEYERLFFSAPSTTKTAFTNTPAFVLIYFSLLFFFFFSLVSDSKNFVSHFSELLTKKSAASWDGRGLSDTVFRTTIMHFEHFSGGLVMLAENSLFAFLLLRQRLPTRFFARNLTQFFSTPTKEKIPTEICLGCSPLYGLQ